ncbi:leucine-rich repeat receptor protein kinase EXS [Hibiscus syriacus]|uniref:WAT1-related protein n=1 Tax=Hibiscus syriacus TaxID=106335 RepID=A0A6A2X0X8_HIBSY|nr:WAT1-related protein At5g40210-like [Hibiscus syriacus]KAE8668252.1 leucine-rich repeat receptor protein kinase EXS [Hibiscus syriacus]
MWGASVTAIMVATEFLEVGLNTVNKAAMNRGLSDFVLVFYSNVLGIFLLAPCILIFYRKKSPPALTRSTIYKILLLGVLSYSGQMCTYIGIGYGSPTLASAMADLSPAFTFIISIISRMETLDLGIKSSQAKSLGTLVSITGAFVVTLYKGFPLTFAPWHNNRSLHHVLWIPHSNWIVGGFILAFHSIIFAIILNVQTWIIRGYPAEMLVTLMASIVVAILSSVVSVVVEKDPDAWRIGMNMELIAFVYTAAFAVAFRSVVHKWALRKKGPIYVAMFKPLGMVIALAMGVTFLGDKLYLGSLLGAAIIAIGFYAVIWGQAQEEKMVNDTESSNKDPLLSNTPTVM